MSIQAKVILYSKFPQQGSLFDIKPPMKNVVIYQWMPSKTSVWESITEDDLHYLTDGILVHLGHCSVDGDIFMHYESGAAIVMKGEVLD